MNEELKNILERVYKLYQKYGIKSVTMDDVAHELGISKKTLYQYVADKKDLVSKIADLKVEFSAEHNRMLSQTTLNAIEELVFVYRFLNRMLKDHNPSMMFDLKKYYPDIFEKLVIIRRKMIFEGMMHNLTKGQKEGYYRENFDPEIIAKLHVLRIESLVDSDMFTKEDFMSEKVFIELFNYHLRGIASEKGLKYFVEEFNELKPE
ncbi:MAG: TetR/AcrR family transcriptional regulator [Bacteroidota bacterium]